MKTSFLEFEQPIAELEAKIEELRYVQDDSALDISEEIDRLQQKNQTMTKEIYSKLTAWQISQVARHPQRPYTLDYIQGMFTDFEELHGDRAYADDPAIVGGLARFEDQPVMVVGHQKGRDVKERQYRNFGMPRPEGYRKALRLMRMADKFRLPIITLIDTAGAYPGIGAEERHIAEAIAVNLREMILFEVPIIAVVIGEELRLVGPKKVQCKAEVNGTAKAVVVARLTDICGIPAASHNECGSDSPTDGIGVVRRGRYQKALRNGGYRVNISRNEAKCNKPFQSR